MITAKRSFSGVLICKVHMCYVPRVNCAKVIALQEYREKKQSEELIDECNSIVSIDILSNSLETFSPPFIRFCQIHFRHLLQEWCDPLWG